MVLDFQTVSSMLPRDYRPGLGIDDADFKAQVELAIKDGILLASNYAVGEESIVLNLILHLLVAKIESTEREGQTDLIDSGSGELAYEQYINKRASYITLATSGERSFFTTSHYGRTFIAYLDSVSSAFTINLLPSTISSGYSTPTVPQITSGGSGGSGSGGQGQGTQGGGSSTPSGPGGQGGQGETPLGPSSQIHTVRWYTFTGDTNLFNADDITDGKTGTGNYNSGETVPVRFSERTGNSRYFGIAINRELSHLRIGGQLDQLSDFAEDQITLRVDNTDMLFYKYISRSKLYAVITTYQFNLTIA